MSKVTKIHRPFISYSLVFFQFLLIGLLVLSLPWQSLPKWTAFTAILAVILGGWGVWVMRVGGFNVVPDPHSQCQLVEHGPYRWIRHPMYSSILLFFWPMVLTQPLGWPWLWMSLLTLDLLIKLHYEERLLAEKICGYRAYQQRSHKILPPLF